MNNIVSISLHRKTVIDASQKFSILIPSWNNLPYLQLCINSIRKHSKYPHQIIVHVNQGSDGTLDWVQSQSDIDYSHSSENVGVCYALNACAELAHTDYILYINDDMYVCPGWDSELYAEIEKIGHRYFFLSSTAIEAFPQSACSINGNFGKNINEFDEVALLKNYQNLPMNDWMGATWPPNVVHRDLWQLVGGYSIEFSPGMYSDPDFSMKLWKVGVRLFKGVAKSRVYHFGSVSVKRIKKNKGYYQFISKWGITSSTFSTRMLRRGEPFDGEGKDVSFGWNTRLKNFYKRVQTLFSHA